MGFKVQPKPFNVKGHLPGQTTDNVWGGHRYNLELYRQAVTALIVNERIEMSRHKGMMVREYSERLIQEALINGDTHGPTMELADFWLVDKPAIHKLFKVLVPRLKDEPHSYTRFFNSPIQASSNMHGVTRGSKNYRDKCVLEIIGHPFPPLAYSNTQSNRKMIHNVLLSEARREFKLAKNHEKEQKQEDLGGEVD